MNLDKRFGISKPDKLLVYNFLEPHKNKSVQFEDNISSNTTKQFKKVTLKERANRFRKKSDSGDKEVVTT